MFQGFSNIHNRESISHINWFCLLKKSIVDIVAVALKEVNAR